jgi:hypothetical protein
MSTAARASVVSGTGKYRHSSISAARQKAQLTAIAVVSEGRPRAIGPASTAE